MWFHLWNQIKTPTGEREMPKAIIVQFVGPTNTKPCRWKCNANGIKASYISREECETPEEACAKFAENNGWANRVWIGGGMPQEGSRAFVQCPVETTDYKSDYLALAGKVEA